MMRIVLVDNEKSSLDELGYMLTKYTNVEIAGMFTDSLEALKQIESINPDAVFLDIDMPILSGLNLAREIADINTSIAVIFITAYNNYAVEAFEIKAIDYVMKPIRKDRLDTAIEKLADMLDKGFFSKEPISDKIDALDDSRFDLNKIIVFDGEEYNVINPDDILYIEVQKKDTTITTQQKVYTARKSLDLWESKLKTKGFFRCHRSYMVNLKHITKVTPMFNNNYVIRLRQSSATIPVSKSHATELKRLLDMS